MRISPSYCVVVVALGVLLLGVVELMEPEPVEPVAELSVPGAPIEVPLPVVPVLEPLAVESGVVPMELLPDMLPLPVVVLLLVVSVGGVVVDGVVVDDVEEEVEGDVVAASSRLPQALSDRAASRARAAHCAIGDLIIRNSFRVSFRYASNGG
jgi:hypothetical protein